MSKALRFVMSKSIGTGAKQLRQDVNGSSVQNRQRRSTRMTVLKGIQLHTEVPLPVTWQESALVAFHCALSDDFNLHNYYYAYLGTAKGGFTNEVQILYEYRELHGV
ncbi:hypothetical protein [Neptunicoccus sediminis]|uniref:hypothetical protein n=1 Tax=Neptunicoccus sediminis TaxID=1892596 RepID=UPI0012FFB35F|nr:hypothetical protein [Neptunicoccus sediminis]